MGYLIVLHLESESTHAHWSGRGSQFASRSADGLVASRRLQNLGIITTLYTHAHNIHMWNTISMCGCIHTMYMYNTCTCNVQYMYKCWYMCSTCILCICAVHVYVWLWAVVTGSESCVRSMGNAMKE